MSRYRQCCVTKICNFLIVDYCLQKEHFGEKNTTIHRGVQFKRSSVRFETVAYYPAANDPGRRFHRCLKTMLMATLQWLSICLPCGQSKILTWATSLMVTYFWKSTLYTGMLICHYETFTPPIPSGSSLKLRENIFLLTKTPRTTGHMMFFCLKNRKIHVYDKRPSLVHLTVHVEQLNALFFILTENIAINSKSVDIR